MGLCMGLSPNQLSMLGLVPLVIGTIAWAVWLDDVGLWFDYFV